MKVAAGVMCAPVSPDTKMHFLDARYKLVTECAKEGRLGAPSVEQPTSAQVMISGFMSSSPTSGSVPSACQRRARSGSSVPLSLPLPRLHTLSKKINKTFKKMIPLVQYYPKHRREIMRIPKIFK